MAEPVTATCSREYTAAHHSGPRNTKDIKWVVLHGTESFTAESAARWFENPASRGSAHLVLDDNKCFRTLANHLIPWGAPGANTAGFHIEQAGFAAWTRQQWLDHDVMLRRSAFKTAYHAKLFAIPLRWCGPIRLKLGWKGVTLHRDCTAAFGGDHTCPGPNFPKDVFMQYAKEYHAQLVSV